MNELIEHLAEKATREMDQEAFSEDMNIPAEWYHKFAEVIVRECIQVCKSRVGNSDYNTGRMHCASDLKEHFGVEE